MRIGFLILAVTASIGCTRTAPFPEAVHGFLVDDQLNVFDIRAGKFYSLRPVVEQQLTKCNLPKARFFSIAPNGMYVACVDDAKNIYVLDLSTGRCVKSLSVSKDYVEVGSISWKPDSTAFIFYLATAKYMPQDSASDRNNIGKGFIEYASGPDFQPHALPAIGRITNRWGTYSLARQAWSTNIRFVFGDGDTVKVYDVFAGTVQTLSNGYKPIGVPQQRYIFWGATVGGYAALGDAGTIPADIRFRLLGDATLHLAVEHPVVSPDGNYFIFVNEGFGSDIFGIAEGPDYSLAIYDQVRDKYTKIRDLYASAGFYSGNMDFTRPADGPLINLICRAVWVQPYDTKIWSSWLSPKPLPKHSHE